MEKEQYDVKELLKGSLDRQVYRRELLFRVMTGAVVVAVLHGTPA